VQLHFRHLHSTFHILHRGPAFRLKKLCIPSPYIDMSTHRENLPLLGDYFDLLQMSLMLCGLMYSSTLAVASEVIPAISLPSTAAFSFVLTIVGSWSAIIVTLECFCKVARVMYLAVTATPSKRLSVPNTLANTHGSISEPYTNDGTVGATRWYRSRFDHLFLRASEYRRRSSGLIFFCGISDIAGGLETGAIDGKDGEDGKRRAKDAEAQT
jgi:hypothetical protein